MDNKKRISKKIASIAAAAAVTLSSVSLPAFTRTKAYAAAANTLRLTAVDSSAYGADRTVGEITKGDDWANVNTLGYWSASLKEVNFLKTPEGLATFSQRVVNVYDVGTSADENHHYTENDLKGKHVASLYIKDGDTSFALQGGKLMNEVGKIGAPESGVTIEASHYYVLTEDNDYRTYSGYGYAANVDGVDGTNNVGWQAVVSGQDWLNGADISYGDATMASNYSKAIPLHNEVLRANVTFNVVDKELQTYESEGGANIAGSVYMVYNINNTAENWSADGTTAGGYVIVDKNADGKIDETESKTYIPAYSEADIVEAYIKYLDECQKAGTLAAYGGLYGNATYKEGYDFVLGENSEGLPIVPALVLKPDASGKVTTVNPDPGVTGGKGLGLPVGNYMILQVKTGLGYYLDQDFRPIVSVGYWGDGNGLTSNAKRNDVVEVDWGMHASGYGTGYFGSILTTYKDTEANAAMYATSSPVAYVPTGSNLNLGTEKFAKSVSAQTGKDAAYNKAATYTATSKGGSDGKYIFNKDDPRMKPIAGTSMFTVQNPVVRAGVYFLMADSDDILKENLKPQSAGGTYYNLDTSGKYIIIPQGNGDLNGAKFELTPIGTAATNKVYLYSSKATIKGGSYTYTVKNNVLTIPVDDLPVGRYTIRQTAYGEGYSEGAVTIALLIVSAEDKVQCVYSDQLEGHDPLGNTFEADSAIEDYIVPEDDGDLHLPNELVSGGEIYTLDSTTVGSDQEIELSVFNISNHYVYVGDARYETYKGSYANQIKGRGLSHEKLLSIVNGWTACKKITIKVGETVEYDDTLPYGTYLIVVTNKPEDYEITGDYMKEDSIDKEGDDITFDTTLDDASMLPKIETELTELDSKLDSIPVRNKVYLVDTVYLSNLTGGMDYIVYGALIDRATSDLFKPGIIATAKGTAYLSTDEDDRHDFSLSHMMTAKSLLDDDRSRETTFSKDCMAWLLEVQEFAELSENATLAAYCAQAIKDGDAMHSATQYSDEEAKQIFDNNMTRVIATLKYIAKGEGASDEQLDGTLELTVRFDPIDMRDYEGYTLVAYEYLCADDGSIIPAAMQAQNVGELLHAFAGRLLASHRRISDEAQTAYAPTLDIEAKATYTGDKIIDSSETVTGTVSVGNLEIGNRYEIRAWLVDEYGVQIKLLDEDGSFIDYMSLAFTAPSTEYDAVFEFEGLDPVLYNNQRLTVYATLYRVDDSATGRDQAYWLIEKGDGDSMGWTVIDPDPGKNQVDIVAPTIKTYLANSSGSKEPNFDKATTLVDTIHYKGLVPGAIYVSRLTLVSLMGTPLYDDAGNLLTADYRFVATSEDMTVKIPLTFKGTMLRGMSVVAFNDLYRQTTTKLALVAQEHNTLESDQTISASGESYRIAISTIATNPDNNMHVAAATNGSAINDHVVVRNLEPNTQYTIITELAYAKDGKPVTQFSPVENLFETDEYGRATFDIGFTFNALVFKGQTLVVYQTIYDQSGYDLIAEHKDYKDYNQMIMIPEIDTIATADDAISKTIMPVEKQVNATNDPNGPKNTVYLATVLDTIRFTNLLPGNQYQLTTEIVTRNGGGSVGSMSTMFIPGTATGATAVAIDIDVTNYLGMDLVVYETLTDIYSGAEVIRHQDIMDKDQTVSIFSFENETPKGDDPTDPDNPGNNPGKPGDGTDINTGVNERYGMLFGIAGGILAIAGILACVLIYRRRKGREQG